MRIKKPISCLDCIYHSEDDGTGLHECIHPNKQFGDSPIYDLRICEYFEKKED